jgi:hypothetical protein
MVVQSASTAVASAALRFAARHGVVNNALRNSSIGSSRALVAGISASAAAALVLNTCTRTRAPYVACRLEGKTNDGRRRPRPPPRFTRHVPRMTENLRTGRRSFSSSRVSAAAAAHDSSQDVLAAADAIVNKKKDDCPICRKYSKGPCGRLFTDWMACADANSGKDRATGEDLHLTQCSELAEKLAKCLGEHAEEYSGPLNYDGDDVDDKEVGDRSGDISIKDLADAWYELIGDLESPSSTISKKPFPSDIAPELEVRPSSGWGVGAFAPTDGRGEPLVLAYLRDQSGVVLAAGSGEDLGESGGLLRFHLHKNTDSVSAYAIYGGEEGDPIYKRTVRIPPKDA